eukprot:c15683_g1_i2.p1 GENE.c15683_g1_i2~~c15683_g1_i2.p1  ORF type:complete len:400 (-),score=123.71 c15683_g1_i2:83-1282(-)
MTLCQEILSFVNQTNVPVKSYFFREKDKCVFVYFNDEDQTNFIKQMFNNSQFHGNMLKACSPLEYFGNEDDARPGPKKVPKPTPPPPPPSSSYYTQTISRSSSWFSSNENSAISNTIVVKNLKSEFQQEHLLDVLNQLSIYPETVNYHFDSSGHLKGIAFLKFADNQSASLALTKLMRVEVAGKPLRVEYKKKSSSSSSIRSRSSLSTFSSFDENSIFKRDKLDDPLLEEMIEELNNFADSNSPSLRFPPPLTVDQCHHISAIADALSLFCSINHGVNGRFAVIKRDPFPPPEIDSPENPHSDSNLFLNKNKPKQNEDDVPQIRRTQSAPKPLRGTRGATSLPTAPPVFNAPLSVLEPNIIQMKTAKGPDGTRGFTRGRGRVFQQSFFTRPTIRTSSLN